MRRIALFLLAALSLTLPAQAASRAAGARVFMPLVQRNHGAPHLRIACLQPSGRQETVCIWNDGAGAQDMTGWRIHSVEGDQWYTFPAGYLLTPGATVHVNSGPDATHYPPADLRWAYAYIWRDAGDAARLYNASSILMDSWSY